MAFSKTTLACGLALVAAGIAYASVENVMAEVGVMKIQPRVLDENSVNEMTEEGQTRAAAPECKGQLGWVYNGGYCYMFTSYHANFLTAEEQCNEVGAYLADVTSQAENDFIKKVLTTINPKDGTDYWLGGLDEDKNKVIQWVSGAEMPYTNWVSGEPKGQPYMHMNFDAGFAWDTKDDANDQDNGFVCKKIAAPDVETTTTTTTAKPTTTTTTTPTPTATTTTTTPTTTTPTTTTTTIPTTTTTSTTTTTTTSTATATTTTTINPDPVAPGQQDFLPIIGSFNNTGNSGKMLSHEPAGIILIMMLCFRV